MNTVDFLSRVRETYAAYEASLSGLSETQLVEPRTCGEWSGKDVIAHVSWYEREMVGFLSQRALIGSNLWSLPLEGRNAAIRAANRERPLADVLVEASQVHKQLIDLLAGLSDDDLLDPGRFAEMPTDWIPWELIASNTCEHYPEHAHDLRSIPAIGSRAP